jgi:hypothetical protein
MLWARSSALSQCSRDAEEEQTRGDDKDYAEDNDDASLVASPVLSLSEETVDCFAGFEWGEGCHFRLGREVSL